MAEYPFDPAQKERVKPRPGRVSLRFCDVSVHFRALPARRQIPSLEVERIMGAIAPKIPVTSRGACRDLSGMQPSARTAYGCAPAFTFSLPLPALPPNRPYRCSREERSAQLFPRISLDAHGLLASPRPPNDRDPSARDPKRPCHQLPKRLVCLPLDRRRTHAHEQHALPLADDLGAPRAGLYPDPDLTGFARWSSRGAMMSKANNSLASLAYSLASLAHLKSCEPPAPPTAATESLVVPIQACGIV